MKPTPESITDILRAKAAAKIKTEIEAKFQDIWNMVDRFRGTGSYPFLPGMTDAQRQNAGHYGSDNKWIGTIYVDCKSAFIEALTPLYQDEAVRDFVTKIEKLEEEIQGVKDSVYQN